MRTLSVELRNQLARTVLEARKASEKGARQALEALAIHHHEPYGSMSKEDRDLRIRLRAHGRQLGDDRDPQRGAQAIGRLVHECAFEHWHRMLFARFLAENSLLLEPEHKVAVSLEECKELARAANEDPWAMASRFAQRMLPKLFREDDPVLAVQLSPESRQALERLVSGLPAEVFAADDSLGWTYQFWQAERKDEVNRAGNPIGAQELPAVTQLFTEHYMVLFLLHNTIGAWHAGRILSQRHELAKSAPDEAALRAAAALSGYEFEYLRFIRDGTDTWRPAAGSFEKWPSNAKEITVLDPCAGSGHFLVSAFDLLVRLRMFEEKLDLEAAIRKVLAENLYGLEFDARCTQIGAFAVALRAWKWLGRPVALPPVQIACSGLAVGAARKEWLALASGNSLLKEGMGRLYDLFEQAPTLGSLIDPARMLDADIFSAGLDELEPLLQRALASSADATTHEAGVAAAGMVDAVRLLRRSYTLVVTNPPYLGRGRQSKELIEYADAYEQDAKKDLATVFLSRSLRWCGESGTVAFVTPQNWLFLTTYTKLRESLLKHRTWNVVARLGPGAFETIGGHVVNVSLITLSATGPVEATTMAGIDVSAAKEPSEKAVLLRGGVPGSMVIVPQAEQLKNPDAVIKLEAFGEMELLGTYASCFAGILNGDSPKFRRYFCEFREIPSEWVFQQSPLGRTIPFGGRTGVIFFDEVNGHLREDASVRRERLHDSDRRGNAAWGKWGVGVSQMHELPVTLYTGEKFDASIAVIFPKDQSLVPAIWAFCSSAEFQAEVRRVNQKLSVENGYFENLPFDLAHWRKVAMQQYPNGLPEPESDDPTQWLFHGHPAGMLEAGDAREPNPVDVLQVAVARIVGYRWPAELDSKMRLDGKARAWVNRCAELASFVDDDGVVPIISMYGERGAAERVRELLETAYRQAGLPFSQATVGELIAATNSTARTLDDWLANDFFRQHCALFHQLPFVWHLWDGRKDGFNVLVHYHRLAGPGGAGRKLLEKITHTHLGNWVDRQRAEQREGREGAEGRLVAAQALRQELEKILEGEPPYDLFIRWKPLVEQPIGWEPDINDGGRMNIRPFLLAKDMGKKGAGLLRERPNIKWAKDRGAEPQSLRPKDAFPWFWGCDPEKDPKHQKDFAGGREFTGNRWNDLHYSNAVKRRARSETAIRSRT